MEFRLFYEGRFLSAQGDPQAGQVDKKSGHKHALRRAFHAQLKDFWRTNRYLNEVTLDGGPDSFFGLPAGPSRPMVDVLAEVHARHGFRFVPLVCEQFKLTCRLDILLMRRDKPGGIFQARDIDNRLKVLFDALKVPKDLGELGAAQPQAGEDPFFTLLQSDDLITHVSVETDDLLAPPPGTDDSYARVVIKVTIKPYIQLIKTSGFN